MFCIGWFIRTTIHVETIHKGANESDVVKKRVFSDASLWRDILDDEDDEDDEIMEDEYEFDEFESDLFDFDKILDLSLL